MTNKRYVEIDKCFGCEHYGHSTDGNTFVPFCANPNTINIDEPRHTINMGESKNYYPIIKSKNITSVRDVCIPEWCDLPNPNDLNLDKYIEWTAITKTEFNNTIEAFNPSDLDYQFYSAVITGIKSNSLILILSRKLNKGVD